MTSPAGAGHRRELTAAMAGVALAGGLALMASAQTWVEVTVLRAAPLPSTTEELSGGEAAPLVAAMGLLLLAAALALMAVRGPGRVLVGAIAALAGAVLAWSGLGALLAEASPDAGRLAQLVSPGDAGVQTAESVAWPVLATVAGLVAVAAGGLVAVRGRRWPGPSRRYERTAAAGATPGAVPGAPRPATDEDRAQAAWTALDRGEDPTDGPGTDSGRP